MAKKATTTKGVDRQLQTVKKQIAAEKKQIAENKKAINKTTALNKAKRTLASLRAKRTTKKR